MSISRRGGNQDNTLMDQLIPQPLKKLRIFLRRKNNKRFPSHNSSNVDLPPSIKTCISFLFFPQKTYQQKEQMRKLCVQSLPKWGGVEEVRRILSSYPDSVNWEYKKSVCAYVFFFLLLYINSSLLLFSFRVLDQRIMVPPSTLLVRMEIWKL